MRNSIKLLLAGVTTALFIAAPAFAASSVSLSVNNAYAKGNGNYDVVVKANPNEKLALYLNDKNPVYATANKKDWATFHKVKLSDKAKLSFTQVFKTKNSKSVQKPINYVRYASLNGSKFSFAAQIAAVQSVQTQAATTTPASTTTTSDTTNTGVNDTNLSNNNTYVNSDGTTVHSPADSTNGSVPAGATAQCVDGTYSFSQTHSGTCSHHGGVASWL